jgi:PAS domain S-box-containing protein
VDIIIRLSGALSAWGGCGVSSGPKSVASSVDSFFGIQTRVSASRLSTFAQPALPGDPPVEWSVVDRAVVEAEPFAAWLVRDGRITQANAAAVQFLGAPGESELRGVAFEYFVPQPKRELIRAMFERSREEGRCHRMAGCVLHTLAEADAETELTVTWLSGLPGPAHLVAARPRSADECLKQETEVWRTLAVLMGTATSLDEALARLLTLGCQALSQRFGCAWLPTEGPAWVCRVVVAPPGTQIPEALSARRGLRQGVEQGAIARGGVAPHYLLVGDLRTEPGYPLGSQLAYLGLDSAALIPVRSRSGELFCVLEYLGKRSDTPDSDEGEWWSSARAMDELAPVLLRLRDADSARAETRASDEALAAIGIGIWSWDLKTNRCDFSPEWRALLGLEPGDEPLGPQDWEARLHPQDRMWVRAALDRGLSNPDGRCSLRFRLRHALGHYVWVLHQSVVVRDEFGGGVRLFGSHTRQSELEQGANEFGGEPAENPLALLSPLGIFHTDPLGKCIYVNERWSEITGLSSEEALGDGWAEALHPEDRARVFSEWAEATRTGRVFKAEYRFVDRQGICHPVLGQALAIRDGRGSTTGFVGSIVGLSDRRRVEEDLRHRDQTYRTLVETTDTGFCVVDARGCIVDANTNYVRMIGRTHLSEILGKCVLDWTWPAERERNQIEVGATFTRGFVRNLRMTYVSQSGEPVPIEINATVIDGPEGPRAVALCRDVRELIRFENRLRNSAMQLKALSRRLIEVQELERRHLARELHDEIGQVLTAVSINLKSLQFGMESTRPTELDDSIGQVDNAIQQVRNLSLDLRPSMLDDLGLEAAVRWLSGRMIQRTGLEIRLECDFPGPRPATAVETGCFRVVQESLTNIARHARASHVRIELKSGDDGILVRIADNGSGFDASDVFSRRSEQPTAGLLGMRERVQLLGGELSIDSAWGSGTTVTARVPNRVPGAFEDSEAEWFDANGSSAVGG